MLGKEPSAAPDVEICAASNLALSGHQTAPNGGDARHISVQGRLRTVSRNTPVIRKYDAQRPGADDNYRASGSSSLAAGRGNWAQSP